MILTVCPRKRGGEGVDINGLPQEAGGGEGGGGQSTENLTFSGFQMGAAEMD